MQQERTFLGAEVYENSIIPSRATIPDEPRPGNYVVIDVTHFSTTVLELLHAGASCVHVPEERGDEFEFKERHPRARIGGGSSADYTPQEGYDFFNSPSNVQTVDVEGRPTALTSSNGGMAITDLRMRGGSDVDVYVGSTSNARAIADFLRNEEKPTTTVAAGSKGKSSPEDTIGAVLIHRYLTGDDPTDRELGLYREIITAGKAAKYVRKAEIRYRDLLDYSLAINTRTEVPKLEGQRLVDVAEDRSER
jgi:2-phosphosulfolactate phosphatase